jgi:hypothetical protein
MLLIKKLHSRFLVYVALLLTGIQVSAARVLPFLRPSESATKDLPAAGLKRGMVLRLPRVFPRGRWVPNPAVEVTGAFPFLRMTSVGRKAVPVPVELAMLASVDIPRISARPCIYKVNPPQSKSPTPNVRIIGSCSSCSSCFSCSSCTSCSSCACSCASCSSCQSCGNCESCGGCGSCASCGGCGSCAACGGCGSCAGCDSCAVLVA